MRQPSDKATVQQASTSAASITTTTRQYRLCLCFVSWFSYFLLTCSLSSGLGHYHLYSRRARTPQMRSGQSTTIATTATLVLFRRFRAISSFRFYPVTSVVTRREASAGRAFYHSSASQASQATSKSLLLLSYQSTERKSLLRRLSSSSEQHKDKDKYQKSSSFSVPAMGTGIDDDGAIATKNFTGYEKWVRRLYATNMFHPVKLGLENMYLLHKLLGNPMDDVSYDCSV